MLTIVKTVTLRHWFSNIYILLRLKLTDSEAIKPLAYFDISIRFKKFSKLYTIDQNRW